MPTPPYVEQTWNNGALGGTPLAARRLNPMEVGIFNATQGVIALEAAVATLTSPSGIVQVGSGAPGIGTPTFPPIYLDTSVTPRATWMYETDTAVWIEVVSDLFQHASGAPTGLTPTFPKFYIDSSTTPWHIYAYDGSAWHLVGDSDTVPSAIQFGSGAPGSTTSPPVLYADTSTTPWSVYVYHSGAWHITGDSDVDSAPIQFGAGTPGVTSPPTTPIIYADTTTVPFTIWVYEASAWNQAGGSAPIQFGAGTPAVTTPPTTPILYADTTTTPWEIWVYDSGTWHLTGDGSGGGGTPVQFGSGTPAITSPTSPPMIYVDSSTVPETPYAWDGSVWQLLVPSILNPTASTHILTSTRGVNDPSINAGAVAQDTLTGGVAYTVDFPNTGLYVGDVPTGQDFQIVDAEAAIITILTFKGISNCLVRIDEIVTFYGLAQGDTVYVSTWDQSFTQVDTSGVLVCRAIFSDNQIPSTDVCIDQVFTNTLVPQIGFILDTASTTVGVDAQVICRVQAGVPNSDTTLRATAVTGLSGNTSVSGQITLSWTAGVGGGAVLDFVVQDLSSGLSYVTTSSPKLITGLSAGSRTFVVTARSAYGYSAQTSGTYTIT
jgi:hypothetical protein